LSKAALFPIFAGKVGSEEIDAAVDFLLVSFIIFDKLTLTMEWTIEYYSEAVEEWVMGMPAGIRARYYAISNRMKTQGPDIGMPHVKPMGDGLYEIRAKGPEGQGRVFYCTVQAKKIIMLHGFIKKTQATPKRELDIARRRIREVKNERTRKGH